jgi:flagellar biosynthesis protein FlhB
MVGQSVRLSWRTIRPFAVSEESESDKPHDPSQKRLDDAREKGEIPYSADLTTAAAYAGFAVVAAGLGASVTMSLATRLSNLIAQSDSLSADVFAGGAGPFSTMIFQSLANPLLLWLGVPAVFAFLSILGQQGMTFAGSKLALKLNRISPLASISSKFGVTGLVEFAKSVIKLCLYLAAAAYFIKDRIGQIVESAALEPRQGILALLDVTLGLLLVLLLVALGLGLLDLVWQRINHLRKNRMSRQELLDEMKDSEGDPATKQQRRARGINLAMNQMLADVPKADVVIVNPTHYAVALKWNRATRRAPVCVAKGTDDIAARIREIAAEHAIPIQSDPPAARALYAGVAIGEEISREHYAAVAAAIRFAEQLRKKARK